MVQTATALIRRLRSLILDGGGRLSAGGRADSWISSNPPSPLKPADGTEPAMKTKNEQKQTKETKSRFRIGIVSFVPFCSRFSNPQSAIRNPPAPLSNVFFVVSEP